MPPLTKQLILEFHHFSLDARYGSSPPQGNTYTKLLNKCSFQTFWTRDHWLVGPMQNAPKVKGSCAMPERYALIPYICPDCTAD